MWRKYMYPNLINYYVIMFSLLLAQLPRRLLTNSRQSQFDQCIVIIYYRRTAFETSILRVCMYHKIFNFPAWESLIENNVIALFNNRLWSKLQVNTLLVINKHNLISAFSIFNLPMQWDQWLLTITHCQLRCNGTSLSQQL